MRAKRSCPVKDPAEDPVGDSCANAVPDSHKRAESGAQEGKVGDQECSSPKRSRPDAAPDVLDGLDGPDGSDSDSVVTIIEDLESGLSEQEAIKVVTRIADERTKAWVDGVEKDIKWLRETKFERGDHALDEYFAEDMDYANELDVLNNLLGGFPDFLMQPSHIGTILDTVKEFGRACVDALRGAGCSVTVTDPYF